MAMVNVAEKGFVSYELGIETGGGHSSNPPAKNTIGMLAKAIYDLEQNQLDFKMVSPLDQQIAYLGPEMPFGMKLVFSNPWLFKNLILEGFTARTTTAPTIFNSGIKDNVIPTVAKATVNFRILPGETSETVKQHIIDVIENDQITLRVASDVNEPSPVSEVDADGFRMIEKTIKQLYPEAVVVPGLIGGGTDSKHFYAISDNVYRFYPMHYTKDDEGLAHGINERMKTDDLKECVQFVYQLIKNANL
jgi:carboxypeptidase PM20D1